MSAGPHRGVAGVEEGWLATGEADLIGRTDS